MPPATVCLSGLTAYRSEEKGGAAEGKREKKCPLKAPRTEPLTVKCGESNHVEVTRKHEGNVFLKKFTRHTETTFLPLMFLERQSRHLRYL